MARRTLSDSILLMSVLKGLVVQCGMYAHHTLVIISFPDDGVRRRFIGYKKVLLALKIATLLCVCKKYRNMLGSKCREEHVLSWL